MLVIASRRGHSEVVRELIVIGSTTDENVDRNRFAAILEENRFAAILEAVRSNRYDVVKLFVEQMPALFGEYINSSSVKLQKKLVAVNGKILDENPLYLSIEKGNQQIAKLVSYHGLNGRTALHAAAITNSTECTKMLLEKVDGLIIPKKDDSGWTALHYAAKLKHTEIVKLLLSKDPSMGNIFSKRDDSRTALHIAVINGHLDVVIEILFHFSFNICAKFY